MTRGRRTEGRAGCMPHGTETNQALRHLGWCGCVSLTIASFSERSHSTRLTECVSHNTDRVRVCHNLVLVSIQYSYSRCAHKEAGDRARSTRTLELLNHSGCFSFCTMHTLVPLVTCGRQKTGEGSGGHGDDQTVAADEHAECGGRGLQLYPDIDNPGSAYCGACWEVWSGA